MDKEIKERIAAINSGIIPEGYKKTKVGIFPQDWKEEKIGDMFYKVMERNNGQFDKTKWISVAKMYYQEPEKVTSNNIDTRTYVMRLGDMAFEGHPNKNFLFGRFVVNDLGDGIISELFPIYRHRKQYVTNYWKYAIQFESIMARIYIRCITMSGASSNKINDDEFKKESLFLPPLPEQQKIAEILSTQDKLIELQEKKIEQLKELKKAYLQKMFPQKGSKYPELRFKGFTDPWEQRKLDEISADYKNSIVDGPFGSDLKTADYTEGGVLVMQSNYITSGKFEIKQPYYVSIEKAEQLSRCHCKGGDILIAKIGANFGICYIIPENIEDAVLSSNCMKIDLDEEHDNEFYMQYLNVLYESGYYYSLVGITAQPALSLKFMKSLIVPSPSFEEQRKISVFLNNLDNLITLHQRKSEQEKQKKKALMQLLLTGIVRTK